MKELSEYIKESILDDEDEVMDQIGSFIVIEKFLKNNYNLRNCKYEIKGNIVDVTGLIKVKNLKITSLTNGSFNFGTAGVFYCNGCENLTNLEGAPRKVKGLFDCSHCKNLTSLEGAPEEVGGAFDCRYNEKLTSLKGGPKEIGEFIGYPDSIPNIKVEIKKNNIKVKEGYSEVGQMIQF